jgi:GH24 family phage-related lysozyme (muramidase)
MTAGNREDLPNARMQVDRANADDFGGQIGRAAQGLADAGLQLAAKIKANADRVKDFDYEKQFLQLQEQDNLDYQERQRTMQGAADGHWMTARDATAGRFGQWLESLPADKRAEYAAKAQSFQNRRTAQAFQDQYQQQDANTRLTLTEEQRKAGVAVQQQPASYEQFVKDQEALIDKSTLTPLDKQARKQELRNSLAFTAAQAAAQQNPEGYISANMQPGPGGMKDLLRRKEGFRETPYWDVNAWRIGYGSDTITKADGTIVRVEQGMSVSREDAERDLDRRIKDEYMPAAVAAIGKDAWEKLSPAAQAVMVSLSYNYGAEAWGGPGERAGGSRGALNSVAVAAQSGDPQRLAAAVRNLASHNNGVNAARRNSEADMVISGRGAGAPAPAYAQALTPQQNAAAIETAKSALAEQQKATDAANQAQLAAQRNSVYVQLKEGPAPEATYEAARRTGVLTDISDIQRAERIIKDRQEASADLNVGIGLAQGGRGVANPYDSSHKRGVGAVFDSMVKQGAAPAEAAAVLFDRTGIMPQQFATAMRGAMVSEDPQKMTAALSAASNMLRHNPNAMAGIDGGADLQKQAQRYDFLTQDFGLSSEQAVQRMIQEGRDPERLNPVKSEQMDKFRKDYLTQEKVESRLTGNWFGTIGGQMPKGPQRTAISSIYAEFAREGFEVHRDPAMAMKYADAKMKEQFSVQNGVITRYPPDKAGLPALPGAKDGHKWVNEQAAQIVQQRLGVIVGADQIVLMPVDREGANTGSVFRSRQGMEVTRSDSGNPQQRTTYRSVPYQIVVTPKDETQQLLILDGAFFPDIEQYVTDKNKANAKLVAKGPVEYIDQFGLPATLPPYLADQVLTPEQAQRKQRREAEQRLREETERFRADRAAIKDQQKLIDVERAAQAKAQERVVR